MQWSNIYLGFQLKKLQKTKVLEINQNLWFCFNKLSFIISIEVHLGKNHNPYNHNKKQF